MTLRTNIFTSLKNLIILMMKKHNTLTMRYSALTSCLTTQRNGKFRSLIQIRQAKNDMNTTLTKYRSIREIKRLQQKRRAQKNQTISQYQRQSQQRRPDIEQISKDTDVIEVIKLKLHEHDSSTERANLRVKTQYTMNRSQFKDYIKKKKTFEFINSKSLELIKSFLPKKLDLIINPIKSRKNQQGQMKIPNEIIIDLKNRPTTALGYSNKHPGFSSRCETKTIQNPKLKLHTSHNPKKVDLQIKDLSGWETNQYQEDFIFGQSFRSRRPKSKLRSKR